jgi:hypothetical protein
MIIETPIGKDKIFQIDTDKLEYDKKGKIVNCSEIKLPRSVKNDPEMLEHYKKWYSLVEIKGRFYDRTMLAAVLRGTRVTVTV